MSAKQRLFFALWPDHNVRQALKDLVADLPLNGGREVHSEDLHITLQFLGQVTADLYPCLEQIACNIKASLFHLKIDTIGYWKRPGIIWCKPTKSPRELTELVFDLQKGLLTCGFKPEKRVYTPHVTLVRNASTISSHLLDHPIDWNPEAFVLVASDSSERVPRYTVLKRWSLVPRVSRTFTNESD